MGFFDIMFDILPMVLPSCCHLCCDLFVQTVRDELSFVRNGIRPCSCCFDFGTGGGVLLFSGHDVDVCGEKMCADEKEELSYPLLILRKGINRK